MTEQRATGSDSPSDTDAQRTGITRELPLGVVVVRGDDIGVIGAVTVEVDGEPVCLLHPSDMQRSFRSVMGRTSTTMTLGEGAVRWIAGGPRDA